MNDCIFATYTGNSFDFFDFSSTDMYIEDIAHSLSMICRFGGHISEFYSVAQHSVIVSKLCVSKHKMDGLLHDATEAYIGDIIRPFKKFLSFNGSNVYEIERKIYSAIATNFNIQNQIPKAVRKIDEIVLTTEANQLLKNTLCFKAVESAKLKLEIKPLSQQLSKILFLDHFYEILKIRSETVQTV